MVENPDFIAELRFESTEKGGRKTGAISGYRPHIEFDNYPEYLTSGQQHYINKSIVYPSEQVKAKITIYSIGYFKNRLYTGMKFKFSEGKRIIGYGKIIDIINPILITTSETSKKLFNFNLYPNDITTLVKKKFGIDEYKIIRELQELIKLDKSYRNPRLIRAIIYLIINEKYERKKLYNQVITNWETVIKLAEYDEFENQIRDLKNGFENFNKK